jgi:hypothetical protein
MRLRKTFLSTICTSALFILISGHVYSQENVWRHEIQASCVSIETGIVGAIAPTIYTGDWANVGAASCTGWTPATGTIDSGTSFTQDNDCTQSQARIITHQTENSFSGEVIVVQTETETRVVPETTSRPATGTKVTGYYGYTQTSTVTLYTWNGTYADSTAGRALANNYMAGTKWKETYPDCRSYTTGTIRYTGGVGGWTNQGNNNAQWVASGTTWRCEYKTY